MVWIYRLRSQDSTGVLCGVKAWVSGIFDGWLCYFGIIDVWYEYWYHPVVFRTDRGDAPWALMELLSRRFDAGRVIRVLEKLRDDG